MSTETDRSDRNSTLPPTKHILNFFWIYHLPGHCTVALVCWIEGLKSIITADIWEGLNNFILFTHLNRWLDSEFSLHIDH